MSDLDAERAQLGIRLCAVLVMAVTLCLCHNARAAQASAWSWVVDPLDPQADLPPIGHSLFDRLFSRAGRYAVPYPFPALLRRLEQYAGVDALGRPGLKHVLIPLGRSLQRTAAAPDYFRLPRVVVAIDGETDRRALTGLLKDRLYIGYQEKAAVLEVISYNAEAGRFEFQIVKDYRAGARPQVFYANRAVCMSCHQNAAPIFSRQQWDETNANPHIAAALLAQHAHNYGIAVTRGVDEPYAIDNATDRANLLSAWQTLWRDGCGNGTSGDRCRAGAFVAMLQARLSGGAFDRESERYRQHRRVLEANWQRLWLDGLAIPDPNLPNRAVLTRNSAYTDAHDEAALVEVSAPFEPLASRPPLESWSYTKAEDLDRLIGGLGEFVAQRDVRRLDRALRNRGNRAKQVVIAVACAPVERKLLSSQRVRLGVRCPAAEAPGAAALRARIYLDGTKVVGGAIEGLRLSGSDALPALSVVGGVATAHAVRLALRKDSDSAARAASGDRIEAIALDWSLPAPRASIRLREDFGSVEMAIDNMLTEEQVDQLNPFAAVPIDGTKLMDTLLARLDGRKPRRCCIDREVLPKPRVEQSRETRAAREQQSADASVLDLTRFYRACGTCHDTPDPAPPNFLAGDAAQAQAQFRQCAPRIRARLQMWAKEPSQRVKTPMPPPLGIHLLGSSLDTWPKSAELQALLQQVDRVVGNGPSIGSTAGEYERLPRCMPLRAAGFAKPTAPS